MNRKSGDSQLRSQKVTTYVLDNLMQLYYEAVVLAGEADIISISLQLCDHT